MKMLSRGKLMVSLALQSSVVGNDTQRQQKGIENKSNSGFTDYNNNETESSANVRSEEIFSNQIQEPLTNKMVQEELLIPDTNFEKDYSSDMSFDFDESFEDLMAEEAGGDDDVKDPSYKPESEESSESEDQLDQDQIATAIDHEEIIEQSNNSKRRMSCTERKKNTKLRMEGKSYKGMQKVDGKWKQCNDRGPRILCPKTCSKRCDKSKTVLCSSITAEDRTEIFDKFWATMNWEERKVYVNALVGTADKVSQKTENSRKQKSYQYYLWKNNSRLRVCKGMFLSTLGIGEHTVYGWCQNALGGIPHKKDPKDIQRRQAQRTKRHEELRQGVRQFLEELPKLESHYCRASSSKLYIEPLFDSISALCKEYERYCERKNYPIAKRTLFQSVFDEMNLSIFTPKKDQCDICCAHQTANISDEVFQAHIAKKNAAREEKARDKEIAAQDKSVKVVTMDLQSVLLCPKLNASALYYRTKLCCHNFTLMDLINKQVQCYFWNESQGDLSANSFASCVVDYIENIIKDNPGIKLIIIYSDGCTYQNRNCVLSNAISHVCRIHKVEITQKFLEKGHTQMEDDSVHSVIERKIRRKNVYVPQHYVEAIQDACAVQAYAVQYVDYSFFKRYSDLQYYSTIRPGIKVGDPVVTDIRCIHYDKDGNVTIKLSFNDVQFSDLPRRARCLDVPLISDNPPLLHSGPLAIKSTKFRHLQEMKSVIPGDYHAFFDNLLHK